MLNILNWGLDKLPFNGWKTFTGVAIKSALKLISLKYPGAPLNEVEVVLHYVADTLLAVGAVHIGIKNVKN